MQGAWLTRGGTRPVLERDCGDGEVWCAEQAVQSPASGPYDQHASHGFSRDQLERICPLHCKKNLFSKRPPS